MRNQFSSLVSSGNRIRQNEFTGSQHFQLPDFFDQSYKDWQKKYSEEIIVSLPLMTAKERINLKELENRKKVLEKQLELAQMRLTAVNTMIDIAEKEYKLEIRKKSGPKQ